MFEPSRQENVVIRNLLTMIESFEGTGMHPEYAMVWMLLSIPIAKFNGYLRFTVRARIVSQAPSL
jgi:hypothetical protein